MAVASISSSFSAFPTLSLPTFRVTSSRSASTEADAARVKLQGVLGEIVSLRSTLEKLSRSSRSFARRLGGGSTAARAAVGSASAIGLSSLETASTLTSTEEVNATGTSYTPFGPDITGDSTTVATVSGVYDGDQADDTLTFEISRGGVLGEDDVKVKVYDGDLEKIEEVKFDKDDPVGTSMTFENGLVLTLSAGEAVEDDYFTVDVSETQGSAVDPDRAFNGTRNDRPGFEDGTSVTAGSFDVNGVSISVAADDSITSVLARISGSSAGVTASFDAATETILLTREDTGSLAITLENDTSGFLAATKLAGAETALGIDADRAKSMTDVAALGGVQAGTFSINGVSISVDPSVDSLDDVIARIDASDAGVTARYSESGDRLLLSSLARGEDLELAAGSSGFLAATGLEAGTHEARAGSGTSQSVLRSLLLRHGARTRVTDVATALNGVFERSRDTDIGSIGERLRTVLRDAAREGLENGLGSTFQGRSRLRTGLGILLDVRNDAKQVLELDATSWAEALRDESRQAARLLFLDPSGERRDGFVVSLLRAVEQAETIVEEQLGRGGNLLDVTA